MGFFKAIKEFFFGSTVDEETTQNVEQKAEQKQKSKKCWMNNGEKNVFIYVEEKEKYTELGYLPGRIKKS